MPDKSGQSFKELACLYDISNLIEQLDNSLDIIFRGVINLIPPAFDFSELIVVKITVSGREFFSDDFSQPAQLRTCALTVANEPVGELLVGYRPGLNFDVVETLLESRTRMLELIAERLSRVIKQNQTEETLRLSEERFHLAVRGSNDGLWDRPDLESDEEWWSPRFYELFGYQPGEIKASHSTFISLLHPDDQPGTLVELNKHLQQRTPYDIEYRLKTKNGQYRWFRARAQALWNENGEPIRIAGSVEDIDDRKKVESAWRQYEFLVNNSGELMTLIDQNHVFSAVSEAYCHAHQKPSADIIGKHISDVWGQEAYQAKIRNYLEECLAGKKIQYQTWVQFGGLGRRYVDVRYSPYSNAQGDITHAVVVSRDITGQKLMQDDLQQNLRDLKSAYDQIKIYSQDLTAEIKQRKTVEQALQWVLTQNEQVLRAISSILIGVDPYNQITHWNEAAEKTFNLLHTNIIGQTLTTVTLNWDWKQVSQGIAACLRKRSVVNLHEVRYTRLDGKEGILIITINPFEPGGVLLLADDITEYKILEAQLTQAQKLESIGQLAAGIAHEINSPAQFISDNLGFVSSQFTRLHPVLKQFEQLLTQVKANAVAPELVTELSETLDRIRFGFLMQEIPLALEDSRQGIQRVAAIIHAMKIFSHPGLPGKVPTNINQAIESTITVARNEWKYVSELETVFDPHLPLTPCLPNEFNQVILNIIINAAHAIAEVIGSQPARKGLITISTRKLNEEWIEISISDTGSGIPPDIRPKIFDPFFTTKEVGQGTGQGLAIVYSVIVEKHQGRIKFETEMGQGSTFFIHLPLYSANEPLEAQ